MTDPMKRVRLKKRKRKGKTYSVERIGRDGPIGHGSQ